MISKQIFRGLVAAALTFLAGCGGGGGGGGGGPGTSSKLFVADSGNCAIGSMIDPNPTPGTATVDRTISGPSTGLGTCGGTPSVSVLPSLALDPAADRMFVSTQGSVLVWDNAGLVNGSTPRTRIITSQVMDPTLRGINFDSLFIDTTNNRLYVAEPSGQVQVYDGASTLSGNATPARSIKPDLGITTVITTFGIAVDLAKNVLYVGMVPSGSPSFVAVFDNQSSLPTTSGTPVAPSRTIEIAGGASSMYLDTVNDRLYVAIGGGPVRVYDSASTRSGAPAGNRTFTLGNTQKYIFVDVAHDRLYGVSENLVFIIPNASTADGPGVTGTVVAVQTTGSLFSAVAAKP
jgi:hypothetical protein